MKRITEEKDIFIPSPDGDIHAIFTGCASGWGECGYCEPEPGEKPLVVMCHGLMMHAGLNPIREMSDSFAGAGYDTLRIDFRGSGKSSGDIEDMTPLTEVADLLHVIDHIVTCSGNAGGRKIVVCGHSLWFRNPCVRVSFFFNARIRKYFIVVDCFASRCSVPKVKFDCVLVDTSLRVENDVVCDIHNTIFCNRLPFSCEPPSKSVSRPNGFWEISILLSVNNILCCGCCCCAVPEVKCDSVPPPSIKDCVSRDLCLCEG